MYNKIYRLVLQLKKKNIILHTILKNSNLTIIFDVYLRILI